MKPLYAILLACLLCGCAAIVAGGAGAGAVAYVEGEYRTTYPRPFERTWQATLDALKSLEIAVYRTQREGEPVIEGTRRDGANVRVAFEIPSADETIVKIRVGTFGDEASSRAIDNNIQQRLGLKR